MTTSPPEPLDSVEGSPALTPGHDELLTVRLSPAVVNCNRLVELVYVTPAVPVTVTEQLMGEVTVKTSSTLVIVPVVVPVLLL